MLFFLLSLLLDIELFFKTTYYSIYECQLCFLSASRNGKQAIYFFWLVKLIRIRQLKMSVWHSTCIHTLYNAMLGTDAWLQIRAVVLFNSVLWDPGYSVYTSDFNGFLYKKCELIFANRRSKEYSEKNVCVWGNAIKFVHMWQIFPFFFP